MLGVAQGVDGCEAEDEPASGQASAVTAAEDAEAALDEPSAEDDDLSPLLGGSDAAPDEDAEALADDAPGTSALVASVGAVSFMVGLASDAVASEGIASVMVASALLLLDPVSCATTCVVPVST